MNGAHALILVALMRSPASGGWTWRLGIGWTTGTAFGWVTPRRWLEFKSWDPWHSGSSELARRRQLLESVVALGHPQALDRSGKDVR